jgi:CheY-like chemotaxis protein
VNVLRVLVLVLLQPSGKGGTSSSGGCIMSESDTISTKVVELPENLSVLFVDDDLVLRKLFSRSVAKAAPTWKIQDAANGETALRRLVDSELYDLIFMDQHMASTDKQLLGTETVRALRAQGFKNTICGFSATDIEESFVSAGGADCFILKPIPCDRSRLEAALDGILSSDRRPLSAFASPDSESND